eukprot:TRINITY_DN27749_c0_g1_i1.p1 TRINITY_DN27749_c0_g1~~TRINITY_DN27749_c0_g1_i1.p1  ORF type:complete len:415 (+),score=115.29 TRINITY_DN27749_c0_g1_i1:106-1350(+)
MKARCEHPTEEELVAVKEQSLSEGINDVGVVVIKPIGVGIRCSSALRTLSKQPTDLEDNRLTNATHNHTAASIALNEATIRFEEQNEVFGICEDNLIAARHKCDALKAQLQEAPPPPQPPENLTPQIEYLQQSLDNCEVQGIALYDIRAREESHLKETETELVNKMVSTESELVELSQSIEKTAHLSETNGTQKEELTAVVAQLREKLKSVEKDHFESLQKVSFAQREYQISRQQHAEIILSCEASLDAALRQQQAAVPLIGPPMTHSTEEVAPHQIITPSDIKGMVGGGILSPMQPIEDIVKEKFVTSPSQPPPYCSSNHLEADNRSSVSPAIGGRALRSCVMPDVRSSLPPPRLPSVMTEEGRSYSRQPSIPHSIGGSDTPVVRLQQNLIPPHYERRIAANRNGMLSPPLGR